MFQPEPSDDRSAADTEPVPNWVSDTWISYSPLVPPPPSDHDDAAAISQLVDSEADFMPLPDYLHRFRDRSVHVTSRQDSVNWILKVNAHYHFSPVTALLAVNYFDRFLSAHSFQPSGWAFQLLSVACLSLAAKLVEPQVPLLPDLQVLECEPEPVFEPVTVQRMELRVLAGLNWKLRSVTPFEYLAHFISRLIPSLPVVEPHGFFNRVLNASSDLILRTTPEIDFLYFRPSTVAAATVLCAAGVSPDLVSSDIWPFHETVNKEMLKGCHQLMEEYLVNTCPLAGSNVASTVAAAPSSPVGVLDVAACANCDTRSENPGSSSRAEAEPSAKRLRSSPPDVQK